MRGTVDRVGDDDFDDGDDDNNIHIILYYMAVGRWSSLHLGNDVNHFL